MKILFLSNNPISEPLLQWLQQDHDVLHVEEKLFPEFVQQEKPDWILSYNYHYLITPDVIALMPEKILNLHISLLPWNRGVHPNLWSFIENTPKGVSIHVIDEGVDTGPLIAQKQVEFNPSKETVKSSYERLHREIQDLFKKTWGNAILATPQVGKGSKHTKKESVLIEEIVSDLGTDISIPTFLDEYNKRKRA